MLVERQVRTIPPKIQGEISEHLCKKYGFKELWIKIG